MSSVALEPIEWIFSLLLVASSRICQQLFNDSYLSHLMIRKAVRFSIIAVVKDNIHAKFTLYQAQYDQNFSCIILKRFKVVSVGIKRIISISFQHIHTLVIISCPFSVVNSAFQSHSEKFFVYRSTAYSVSLSAQLTFFKKNFKCPHIVMANYVCM